MSQTESAGAPFDDPRVKAALETIVQRLAPFAARRDFDFRVRVIESEQVNAFALPGGQIVVFTGLLRRAERAEQVAGVLAHEMAHVTLRHGLRNVAHRAGLALGVQLLLGDVSGWARLAGDAAVLARDQRLQPRAGERRRRGGRPHDDGGRARSRRHGQLLPAARGRARERRPGRDELAEHAPHLEARIAHVEALSRSLPAAPRRSLDVDWAAVKQAVER